LAGGITWSDAEVESAWSDLRKLLLSMVSRVAASTPVRDAPLPEKDVAAQTPVTVRPELENKPL